MHSLGTVRTCLAEHSIAKAADCDSGTKPFVDRESLQERCDSGFERQVLTTRELRKVLDGLPVNKYRSRNRLMLLMTYWSALAS